MMMSIAENVLDLTKSWPCCSLSSVRVDELPGRERSYFSTFLPQAATAIVLGHHIATEEEWTWYATDDGGEHCAADDHCSEICNAIRAELIRQGYEAELVSYPRKSGLQFRFVAQAAGLGDIGTNAFLFHPEWGPWIHLRVMATTAPLALNAQAVGEQLCDRCGLCISECPAGAISDENFNGLQCRSFRRARGEYEPYGPRSELRYCKRCILTCPKGAQPILRPKPGFHQKKAEEDQ